MERENCCILLVEDNADDVLLVKRAFRKAQIANPIHVASDGDAAVAYLAGQGSFADRAKYPMPILILLDLKLPRRSGAEVLAWLREQPIVKRIPVVILTSSREKRDVEQLYDLGANSYLVKPVEFDDLLAMMRTLNMYWLMTNQSPFDSQQGTYARAALSAEGPRSNQGTPGLERVR